MRKINIEKLNEILMQNFWGTGNDITYEHIEQSPGAIKHIQRKHPNDWGKYGDRIYEILNSPDYVGTNPNETRDIEFYKSFEDAATKEVIFVALRLQITNDNEDTGILTLSTLYRLNNAENKIQSRLRNGRIVKYE